MPLVLLLLILRMNVVLMEYYVDDTCLHHYHLHCLIYFRFVPSFQKTTLSFLRALSPSMRIFKPKCMSNLFILYMYLNAEVLISVSKTKFLDVSLTVMLMLISRYISNGDVKFVFFNHI